MKKRNIIVAAWAALAMLIATLLALNLSLGDKQIDKRIARLYSVGDKQFARTMGVILGPALEPGNKIEELTNGDRIFPAMLDAIRGARKTITLETYIFWSGTIGGEFVDALVERARHGVKVHVLLDWVGDNLDERLLDRMEQSGVAVRRYNTPHWLGLHQLNNRTHRKLMVIDGKIGFTGGVGIADVWRGDARDPTQWRDMHYRVEGPVVGQMQAAFIDNWMQATGEVLHGAEYLPPLSPAGSYSAQMFTSSPGGGSESMQLMYLLSITGAEHSIRLSASYFLPDDVAINTLVAALKRGVRVQIIVPGDHLDLQTVRRASRSVWGPLLRAGAEIYEYQPTMYHVKTMIVDDIWVSVGSTNFDARSFAINDEANLNVYDAEFARRQIRVFEDDLKQSRRIMPADWENRPWSDKLLDFCAAQLSSQL
ncbi:MAG TPA: phospholipase D-like domain-containing protein [Paucimonas sp.]|nr:phospholipase D-like domain-containing protein [Paucimonas sp.]